MDLRLLIRIKFGTADFQTKSPSQKDMPVVEQNQQLKRVKTEQKPLLALMDDRTLQEEINEIMKRRKMKFLSCSQGLEYLKFNKKVFRYKKDVKEKLEMEKQFTNNVKIQSVLENKKYIDEEKKEMIVRKIDLQDKKRIMSQISRIGNKLEAVLEKFQNSWLIVFSLVSLSAKIKKIIHNETIKRAQISYIKMRKRRVINALTSFLKKSGENKFQRALYQWKTGAQLFAKQVQLKTKNKAGIILTKLFLNFKDLSILSNKMLELNLRVIKFQNKFSSYIRKKSKYKDEIKRYWNNQNEYLVQQVLYDMIQSNKSQNSNIEIFLKSEMKKAQKSGLKIDYKLQDEIIIKFIKDRTNTWRLEFSQFKRMNFQLFNLKRQLQQEKDNKDSGKVTSQSNKQGPNSTNESLAELFVEPPKLFLKPNEYQLKQMVKQYMAAKKQTAENQQQK